MTDDFTPGLLIGVVVGGFLGGCIGEGCTNTQWRQDMRDGKAPQIIEMLKVEDDYHAKRRALNVERR